IVIVKQLFGGIGHNFANPAIVARIVMLVSFSQSSMTEWVKPQSDLVASATPLDMLYSGKTEGLPSVFDMIMGNRAGSIGETCALAFVFGFVYLVYRRVISWHTPVIFVGTVFVLSLVFTGDLTVSVYHLFSGGLLLGAVFMATDYSTSPPTPWGKVIFALGCGIITVAIRLWGSNPEGVSYGILFMNILTPYISKLTAHRIFGAERMKTGGAV
ncbi:MAG: RnfABCDGE type electron transport complex subunit D, partial [Clostridia bacterium]|nr:RnfABCDGE type electron transport complex subunit D [Clostridia bacterium]